MTYSLNLLPSGLRVAFEPMPFVESVAVSVSVGTGARHEKDAEGGISHLLEHMAFKGTKTRTARDIAEQFDAIGGQFNAYTSVEQTVYYAKVLKNDLPLAMEILADILQHSVFDEGELCREQGVVLQEIAMHQDTPDEWVFDLFDQAAFANQPLGRSILGRPKQVSGYAREHLISYMKRHYTPQNMVLSGAGNVDIEHFTSLAERYFTLGPSPHAAPAPQPGRYTGGDSRKNKKLEQLQLVIGLPACSLHDADFPAMQVFSGILGGGMSSRLFQEVREKRGLAYSVSSMLSSYSDVGVLMLYAGTSEEHSKELPLIMIDELKRMAEPVSEAELSRAKNQIRAELLMSRENPATVAGWIGRHLLLYGRYIELPELLARVDAVNREQLQSLGEKLAASGEQLTVTALGPVKTLPEYEKIASRLHS